MSEHEEIVEFFQLGDFEACRAAEEWCKSRGISVGEMQRGSPRGLLRGEFHIQKWRCLSRRDIFELDGRMTGDMRNGPVTITLYRQQIKVTE